MQIHQLVAQLEPITDTAQAIRVLIAAQVELLEGLRRQAVKRGDQPGEYDLAINTLTDGADQILDALLANTIVGFAIAEDGTEQPISARSLQRAVDSEADLSVPQVPDEDPAPNSQPSFHAGQGEASPPSSKLPRGRKPKAVKTHPGEKAEPVSQPMPEMTLAPEGADSETLNQLGAVPGQL